MKMSVCLLIILFGLVASDKPSPRYGVPKPSETYTYQRVPAYVLIERPKPSKSEEIKAKISSKKEAIQTKLEELKPKIEGKISSTKEAIHTTLDGLKPEIEAKISSTKEAIITNLAVLKPKIEAFKEDLKSKIPIIKSKISDKVSDFKSKFETKHTKPNYNVARYVLVAAKPQHQYRW